jgi:hypothetical protein
MQQARGPSGRHVSTHILELQLLRLLPPMTHDAWPCRCVLDRGAFPGAVQLEIFVDGDFVTSVEVTRAARGSR